MTLRSMSACLVSGVMLLGAGSATAQEPTERAAERLAEFERTGETRSCLGLQRIRSMNAIDDHHFLVEMRNGDMWLNVVPSRCSQASSNFTYIQYRTSGSQLCRNEIIHVVDNSTGARSGGCGLGDFERLIPLDTGDGAASR